jgi:hypothetical protein
MLMSSGLFVAERARNPRRLPRVLGLVGYCAAAALCVFAIAPQRAHALSVAGDLDYASPVNSNAEKSGWGFGIRLGTELHLPLIALTPEIGFTYASFASQATCYRGIVGANLGIGEILRFGVMAHLGIGHLSIDNTSSLAVAGEVSHAGFTFDGGLFLELTLIPLLNVGIHGAYNHLAGASGGDGLQWITAGAHATLVF